MTERLFEVVLKNSAAQAAQGNSSQEGDEEDTGGQSAFSLGAYVDIARRKYWILAICAILMGFNAGYKASKEVLKYESSFRILVEPISNQSKIQSLTSTSKDEKPEINYFTLIEVLYSPKVLQPVAKEVALEYPGVTYNEISEKIKIVRLGETTILEGRYVDANDDKLILILNKVSQAFLEYSIEDQRFQLKIALKFIEEQLPDLLAHADAIKGEIQRLRETYGFIEPQAFADSIAKQLVDTRAKQQAIQEELETMYLKYKQAEATLNAQSLLIQTAEYQELLGEFQTIEEDIARESARFGPQHPTIQFMRRQQQNLLPFMLKEAQRTLGTQLASLGNDILIAEARYESLSNAAASLEAVYREMPKILLRYDELQRDLALTTANLNRFLETRESLNLQAAQNEIPWQLIEAPKEPKMLPVGSPLKAMITGAITGAMLGFAIAYGIEKFEDTYHNLNEVKRQKFIKVLGAIPIYPDLQLAIPAVNIVDLREDLEKAFTFSGFDPSQADETLLLLPPSRSEVAARSQINNDDKDNSKNNPERAESADSAWLGEYDAYGFFEAFRALHLTIAHQNSRKALKSIVISSALPREGRTTVAIHLAQAAAAMSRRVLLVDTHLRMGGCQINNLLGISNAIGLSEYLQGQALLEQVTQKLNWEGDLYVITAGKSHPDPTRLLSSPMMSDLMVELRESFDLVLYSMPPLMGLADVGLMATRSDGVVMVTSLNQRGSITALKNAVEHLKLVQANVVGLVVNQVKNYKVDFYA